MKKIGHTRHQDSRDQLRSHNTNQLIQRPVKKINTLVNPSKYPIKLIDYQKVLAVHSLDQNKNHLNQAGLTFREILHHGPFEHLSRLKLLTSIPHCDLVAINNPQNVSEVAADCTKHMLNEEVKYQPTPNCVSRTTQPVLKQEMRKTLVSWLVEVCEFFKLSVETWFIAVNLVDRYCDRQRIGMEAYQLLGVAAVLIAAKYEEITPPTVKDLVDIAANTYKRQEILEQEQLVLGVLQFDVAVPTTHRFIQRFCWLIQADRVNYHLACYLGEISLLE